MDLLRGCCVHDSMWSSGAGRQAALTSGMSMKPLDGDNEGEPAASPAGNAPRSRVDVGFDRWLRNRLHSLYDPVLNEKVPDELEALLDRFTTRPPDGPAKK